MYKIKVYDEDRCMFMQQVPYLDLKAFVGFINKEYTKDRLKELSIEEERSITDKFLQELLYSSKRRTIRLNTATRCTSPKLPGIMIHCFPSMLTLDVTFEIREAD